MATKSVFHEESPLEDVVNSYKVSMHPDSITTSVVLDAMGSHGIMQDIVGFQPYDSKGLGETPSGEPIVIAGEATLRLKTKGKKGSIEEIDKDIVVVAQNNRLLSPESLIYARSAYQRAERQGLDLLLIANTEGGDAMDHAAFMGQSRQISDNIMTLLNNKTRIASLVLRKGGSGGALSNQVADVALMMKYANYHVISPPHCVSILWSRNPDKSIDDALTLMKGTPEYLKAAGIIDEIIAEYPGGSHLEAPSQGGNYSTTLANISQSLHEVFLGFHNDTSNINRVVAQRLKRAREGYAIRKKSAGDILRKYVPGIDKKTKMTQITQTNLRDLDNMAQGSYGNLVVNLNYQRLRQILEILEKEKHSELKSGASSNSTSPIVSSDEQNGIASIITCGDYIIGKKPGIIYEVDEDALARAKKEYDLGKATWIETMRKTSQILRNRKSTTECRATFTPEEFAANYFACPDCGKGLPMSARDMLHMILDGTSKGFRFREINSDMDVNSFEPTIYHTQEYLDKIQAIQSKHTYTERVGSDGKQHQTSTRSALMTGVGAINRLPAVVCAMDFSFIGGTIGMVEPRKFFEAAEYAIRHDLPVVMMTYSGGARMQENQFALQAMKSMNATVQLLRDNNTFYGVMLMGDTFGGTPASFASQGIVTLAEKGLRYGFTGPVVLERAMSEVIQNPVQVQERMVQMDHMMSSSILKHVYTSPGKPIIDFVGSRSELKNELSKYLASWYGKPFNPVSKHRE